MGEATCYSCGFPVRASVGQTIECPNCHVSGIAEQVGGGRIAGFGSNMGFFFAGAVTTLIIQGLWGEGKRASRGVLGYQ